MTGDETIQITEEDLEQAAQDDGRLVITELDLVGQTESVDIGGKPGVQWTPPTYMPPTKEPVDIILLIDTSGSMGADDYPPNRLDGLNWLNL